MEWNWLYLCFSIPIGIILLAVTFVDIYRAELGWDEYIKERNNIEVKDKKMRKNKFDQLNEQISKLTKQLNAVNDLCDNLSKNIDYLKFKQEVKGDFILEFETPAYSLGMDLTKHITQVEYLRDDGKEGLSVCTIAYPVIKYIYNGELKSITNKNLKIANIYKNILATKLPDDQYVIKLTVEKQYYKLKNKYLYFNLRREEIKELTIEICQELGFDINIDKGRKWFEV